jgi:hypothetical protein
VLSWRGLVGALERNLIEMTKNGKRYKEEQIIYAFRQVEGGRKIAEMWRELGVTEQTYHRWKKKYAVVGLPKLVQ